MVQEIDEDGNGQIEFAEFCHVMDKRSSQALFTADEIKSAFKYFKTAGTPSGKIHVIDLKNCFLENCDNLTTGQINDLVALVNPENYSIDGSG